MDKGRDNNPFNLFNNKCFEAISSSCTIFNRSQYITDFIKKYLDISWLQKCDIKYS